RRIDHSGARVPNWFRIAVRPNRTENGLPDTKLLGRASMRAHDFFAAHRRLHHRFERAVGTAHLRARHVAKWTFFPERVLVFINVHDLVSAKVDGIGAEAPCSVELDGVEDLVCDGLPSACRSAGERARPRLTDAAEASFHF